MADGGGQGSEGGGRTGNGERGTGNGGRGWRDPACTWGCASATATVIACRAQGARRRVQSAECRVHAAGCMMKCPECRGRRARAVRRRTPPDAARRIPSKRSFEGCLRPSFGTPPPAIKGSLPIPVWLRPHILQKPRTCHAIERSPCQVIPRRAWGPATALPPGCSAARPPPRRRLHLVSA